MDVHKKASLLPAMEVSHPGASYNPSFADHQVIPLCMCVCMGGYGYVCACKNGESFMLQ